MRLPADGPELRCKGIPQPFLADFIISYKDKKKKKTGERLPREELSLLISFMEEMIVVLEGRTCTESDKTLYFRELVLV